MNKKKEEHIKNSIRKVGIEKTSIDFTSKVMQDVFMSTNEELLKDKVLTSLLKKHVIEKPPKNLASNVLTQIEATKNVQYKPLISKKTWFIIGGVVLTIMLFIFLNDAPQNATTSIYDRVTPYLDVLGSSLDNPLQGFTISPLLTISLLCISCMLLFDSFLKGRFYSSTE